MSEKGWVLTNRGFTIVPFGVKETLYSDDDPWYLVALCRIIGIYVDCLRIRVFPPL